MQVILGKIAYRLGLPLTLSMKEGVLQSLNKKFGQQDERELEWMLRQIKGVRSILEVGSCFGHTLKAMAAVAAPNARIRSIDLGAGVGIIGGMDTGKYLSSVIADLRSRGYDAAAQFGDSRRPEAVEWARRDGPYDFVFIDGDHSYEGAKGSTPGRLSRQSAESYRCVPRNSARATRPSAPASQSLRASPSYRHSRCKASAACQSALPDLPARYARAAKILRCKKTAVASARPSPRGMAPEAATWFPPACFAMYIPASATRIRSSIANPCTGKLATPKLPVISCSSSIGSVASQSRNLSASTCACSIPVSGIRMMNSSPPYRATTVELAALLLQQPAHPRQH